MLTFKNYGYDKEKTLALSKIISGAISHTCGYDCYMKKFSAFKTNTCVPEPCRACVYGKAINDLYEVKRHIDGTVDNFVESVENLA